VPPLGRARFGTAGRGPWLGSASQPPPAGNRAGPARRSRLRSAFRGSSLRRTHTSRLAPRTVPPQTLFDAQPSEEAQFNDATLAGGHFGQGLQRIIDRHQLTVAPLEALQAYDWPGNVRELQDAIGQSGIANLPSAVKRESFSSVWLSDPIAADLA
jgi:hypothetical protein